MALRVSKSVVTRDVQDQVRPSGFNLAHNSTVRAFCRLKVSSSKKNSFTYGQYSFAFAISRATSPLGRLPVGVAFSGATSSRERWRHGWPLSDEGAREMAKAKEYWPYVKEFFFDD